MKRGLIFLVIMIFPLCLAMANDNITIGLNGISNGCVSPFDIPVLYENDDWLWAHMSTGPTTCNCFALSADEGTFAWFEEDAEYLDPSSRATNVFWSFQYFSRMGDSLLPDVACVSSVSSDYGGLPGGPMEVFFHLKINIEGKYGNVYIDSCGGPECCWIWRSWENNIYPAFNSDSGTHVIRYGGYFCGNANADGNVNVSDAVHIINYVFTSGLPPDPMESGDTNCDGETNVSDAVFIINYVFAGGSIPCDTDGDGAPDC